MKLTEQQVRHVARLARLELGADEVAKYGQQLSAILDAVDALAQVDTTGVESSSMVSSGSPHQRDDVVAGEVGSKTALSNAPAVQGTHFAIPKVIE